MFGPDLICNVPACGCRFMLSYLKTDIKQCNKPIRSKDLFICKQMPSEIFSVSLQRPTFLKLVVPELSSLTSYQINYVLVTRRANKEDIDTTKK